CLCQFEQACGFIGQMLAVWSLCALCRVFEEQGTGAQGERNILRHGCGIRGCGLRVETFLQVGRPGVEAIDPCFERVEPVAERVDGETGSPEIVGKGRERSGSPIGFARGAIEEPSGDVIVAIAEDGGGYRYGIAQDSLCRITSTV